MKIDPSAYPRLLAVAEEQLEPETVPRFIERIETLRGEALFHFGERKAPEGEALKHVRKDIAAFTRVIDTIAGGEEPDRKVLANLRRRCDQLQMTIDHAKEIGLKADFKQKSTAEIIDAVAEALTRHPAELSRGSNPDNGKVSHQFPIVRACCEYIGLKESAISTYQRMGQALAAARERQEEERAMEEWVEL